MCSSDLTGEKKYAEFGRQCFEKSLAGQRDRDDRYSFMGPGGPLRAGPSLGWHAVGYDLCYDGWDAATREKFGRAIAEFMGLATDYPVEREVVGRAMVQAGRCYEALGKRNEALIVYSSLVRKKLPGKAEAEARMKQLRKPSFFFFKNE